MSNEISNVLPAGALALPAQNQDNDRKEIAKLLGSSKFHPYCRLMVTTADEVKKKKAEAGHFIICQNKDTILSHMGDEFEALVLAYRMLGCEQGKDGILRVYNMKDPDWARIKEKADTKGARGCWYGPEFLHWSPKLEKYFTFHASSQTARSRAGELVTILNAWLDGLAARNQDVAEGKAPRNVPWPQARFRSHLQEGFKDDNSQYIPTFSTVSTPFAKLPSWDSVIEECAKFAKPVKEQEKQEEPQGQVADRG